MIISVIPIKHCQIWVDSIGKPDGVWYLLCSVIMFALYQASPFYTKHLHHTPSISTLHQTSPPYTKHIHSTPNISTIHQTSPPYTKHLHPTPNISNIHQTSPPYTKHLYPTLNISTLHQAFTVYNKPSSISCKQYMFWFDSENGWKSLLCLHE